MKVMIVRTRCTWKDLVPALALTLFLPLPMPRDAEIHGPFPSCMSRDQVFDVPLEEPAVLLKLRRVIPF